MGGVAVLDVDSLETERGSFTLGPVTLRLDVGVTGLAGHNGAGKSTLIEACLGLVPLRAGHVSIAGADPARRRERSEAMRSVGFVPQEPQLPSRLTVQDALLYAAWLKRVPRGARSAAALASAERVALQGRLADRVGSLSGGMRRRLAIGQALVHDPAVLLLDEPTVGLDPAQRLALHEVLLGLRQDRTVVISTHLADDLARLCERLVVLRRGRVTWQGDLGSLPREGGTLHDAVDRLLLAEIGDVES